MIIKASHRRKEEERKEKVKEKEKEKEKAKVERKVKEKMAKEKAAKMEKEKAAKMEKVKIKESQKEKAKEERKEKAKAAISVVILALLKEINPFQDRRVQLYSEPNTTSHKMVPRIGQSVCCMSEVNAPRARNVKKFILQHVQHGRQARNATAEIHAYFLIDRMPESSQKPKHMAPLPEQIPNQQKQRRKQRQKQKPTRNQDTGQSQKL